MHGVLQALACHTWLRHFLPRSVPCPGQKVLQEVRFNAGPSGPKGGKAGAAGLEQLQGMMRDIWCCRVQRWAAAVGGRAQRSGWRLRPAAGWWMQLCCTAAVLSSPHRPPLHNPQPAPTHPHTHTHTQLREDEVFRRHPRPLANQRGDDAILECLLYFRSLGAEVGCTRCCWADGLCHLAWRACSHRRSSPIWGIAKAKLAEVSTHPGLLRCSLPAVAEPLPCAGGAGHPGQAVHIEGPGAWPALRAAKAGAGGGA